MRGKGLSQNQRADLRAEVQPVLQPFFDHQGWPSIAAADAATRVLVELFQELGVLSQ